MRVVDAETGQILLADYGKGLSKVSSGGFLGMGTKGGYAESIEGDSLRAAVSQLIENITSQINKKPWSCRVAQVSSGKIYLNAGLEAGLEAGQKLSVFSLGAEIKGAESGLVIGQEEEELGEREISSFFGENGSIGRMLRGRTPKTGDLCRLRE